ncbi:SulP family inorganic anion transporter [Deinococcus sedimenti]|nr:SulP family inorganic anion transporter [Deinococcus sedimenti]
MGTLPTALPSLAVPPVPLTLETLGIILPVAATLALVGLIESLLTAQLIDERTGTSSDKNVESRAQGVANIITGCFGGMAGCAMIGQSMINVTNGGRGRLSTLVAGLGLLALILLLQPLLVQIPLAALVAVMIVVSVSTFDWASVRTLRASPRGETAVMLATVGVTVVTHDLSRGVLVGVVLSALMFARTVARSAQVTATDDGRGTLTYHVSGPLVFVSAHGLPERFGPGPAAGRVVIDLSAAQVWDASAVAALDQVRRAFQRQGLRVDLTGLDGSSAALTGRAEPDALGGH